MNPGAFYSKRIQVQIYECDLALRLRLSYLMRHIQQVSEDQLEAMGAGYQKVLKQHSMVFLLTRIALQIQRMPQAGEQLTLSTRPLESIKAQLFRETVVRDEQGSRLLTAWSAWLLFDPAARRVLRPNRVPYTLNCGPAPDLSVFELPALEGSPAGERVVRFSDVDVNRHLTNSVYGDIAYDCLPWQVAAEGKLATVCFHFQSEAKPGENLALFAAQQNDFDYTVYGTLEQRPCFAARLTFQK